MVAKKQDDFTQEAVACARFAHALAHPARVAIIDVLRTQGEASCGELVALLPLAQATVSQHLRALRDAELIDAHERGQRVCYTLIPEKLKEAAECLREALRVQGVKKATSLPASEPTPTQRSFESMPDNML